MTSQVYYRKWRPSSFSELAGQEHVSTTLRQSVRLGRISHSYLFCGPRGCGKTTTARIIAKAANCLDLQDGDPCNACAVCEAINDGRFMDIIELDAASNRGIDEIRDIRDKVNFAPVQGRRKVYIIDEAHMLTDAASNAFLKTLEEPPEHVIFVLCTTEAHRILPTIISRCQRLDFRRIPSETVFGRLAEIAEAEGVAAEPAALRIIARYAAGSLRDAENLLEQLVVSCPDGVTAPQVEKLLGMGSDESALELVKYLLLGNTTASLSAVNQAAWEGSDLRQLHRQTSDLLRGFMHLQWGSEDAVDLPEHVQGQLRELVGKQPPWRIVHALKVWGAVNMRYDAPSTLPLELAVVEICEESAAPAPAAEAPPSAPAQRAPASQQQPRSAPAPREPRQERPPAQQPAPPRARETSGQPAATSGGRSGGESSDLWVQWNDTVKALSRHKGRKYNLGALLRDCKVNSITLDGKTLTLPFTNKANLERMEEELEDPSSRSRLSEALAQSFGEGCSYQLTLANGQQAGGNANRPSQQSPLVRAALGWAREFSRKKRLRNEPQHDAAGPEATGPAPESAGGAGDAYGYRHRRGRSGTDRDDRQAAGGVGGDRPGGGRGPGAAAGHAGGGVQRRRDQGAGAGRQQDERDHRRNEHSRPDVRLDCADLRFPPASMCNLCLVSPRVLVYGLRACL